MELERLADAKKVIEKQIEEIETEITLLRECLKLIDKELSKKSFITAEKLVEEKQRKEEWTESINITYRHEKEEVLLAKIYINREKREMKIVPELKFSKGIPPFQSFLINRVLEKMKEKDEEQRLENEVRDRRIFEYEVITDNDTIKWISIKNIAVDERIISVKNAVRWTFSRMYEKMKR